MIMEVKTGAKKNMFIDYAFIFELRYQRGDT